MAFLHGTTLDERIVRVELDWGYHPSRRYGRGESGGQVRDEKRLDYDEGRGGYGRAAMYQSVPDPLAEAPQAADPGTKKGVQTPPFPSGHSLSLYYILTVSGRRQQRPGEL